jgi:hypothetical protein
LTRVCLGTSPHEERMKKEVSVTFSLSAAFVGCSLTRRIEP